MHAHIGAAFHLVRWLQRPYGILRIQSLQYTTSVGFHPDLEVPTLQIRSTCPGFGGSTVYHFAEGSGQYDRILGVDHFDDSSALVRRVTYSHWIEPLTGVLRPGSVTDHRFAPAGAPEPWLTITTKISECVAQATPLEILRVPHPENLWLIRGAQ